VLGIFDGYLLGLALGIYTGIVVKDKGGIDDELLEGN